MRRGWRKAMLATVLLALAAVFNGFLVTTEAGAALLLSLLELQSSTVDPQVVRAKADAIAVLGGGTTRLDYGARLSLRTGVPLLLVGKGGGGGGFEAESEYMEDDLLRHYGVGPRWVEAESKDTNENATFSWCLVAPMGVKTIALVTDSYHMPRARRRFEGAGFVVISAPPPRSDRSPLPVVLASFLPSKKGRAAAQRPLREWAGLVFGGIETLMDPPRRCPYADTERQGVAS